MADFSDESFMILLIGGIIVILLLGLLLITCMYLFTLSNRVKKLQRGQQPNPPPVVAQSYHPLGTMQYQSPPSQQSAGINGNAPAMKPMPMAAPVIDGPDRNSPLDEEIRNEADTMWAELQQLNEKEHHRAQSPPKQAASPQTLNAISSARQPRAESDPESSDTDSEPDAPTASSPTKASTSLIPPKVSIVSHNSEPDPEDELNKLVEEAEDEAENIDNSSPVDLDAAENAVRLRRSLRQQADVEGKESSRQRDQDILLKEQEMEQRRQQEYENRLDSAVQQKSEEDRLKREEQAEKEIQAQEQQVQAAKNAHTATTQVAAIDNSAEEILAASAQEEQRRQERRAQLEQTQGGDTTSGGGNGLNEVQQKLEDMRRRAAAEEEARQARIAEGKSIASSASDMDAAKQMELDVDRQMREKAAMRRAQDQAKREAAMAARAEKKRQEEEARALAAINARKEEERLEKERVEKERKKREEKERAEKAMLAAMSPGQRRIYEEHLAQQKREAEFRSENQGVQSQISTETTAKRQSKAFISYD